MLIRDSHLPFQIAIGRAIDLAHAAGADLLGDVIDADTRAGSEGQVVGLYGRSDKRTREVQIMDGVGCTNPGFRSARRPRECGSLNPSRRCRTYPARQKRVVHPSLGGHAGLQLLEPVENHLEPRRRTALSRSFMAHHDEPLAVGRDVVIGHATLRSTAVQYVRIVEQRGRAADREG